VAITQGLFTSKTDEWETPQWLYDELNEEWQFMVDVCASEQNKKHWLFWDKENDGLKQDWHRYTTCWMNPPYGREIGKWVKKAYEESQKGATVVCLLPARTDTIWFHEYCTKGEIRFLKGRLKFGDSKNPAPFPSMIVIFKGVMA
jgi:phage N-6-adenine-methyltransferase